jgi:rhodanese-related sulfurtransferase
MPDWERVMMKKNWILQIIIILVISTVTALTVNSIRTGGIALVGNWPIRPSTGEGPIIPPSAEAGDPPFVTLEDAVTLFQSPHIIFIDARDVEDYDYGHISGSINIPYDYLDEYWESVIDTLDRDREYVIYCSGGECESSLLLGRYLDELGFFNLHIFYGGWEEWEINGLPIVSDELSKGEAES